MQPNPVSAAIVGQDIIISGESGAEKSRPILYQGHGLVIHATIVRRDPPELTVTPVASGKRIRDYLFLGWPKPPKGSRVPLDTLKARIDEFVADGLPDLTHLTESEIIDELQDRLQKPHKSTPTVSRATRAENIQRIEKGAM